MKTTAQLLQEIKAAEENVKVKKAAWRATSPDGYNFIFDNAEYKELYAAERLLEGLHEQYKIAERYEVKVGDGVTYHLYSDSHACTVIKRTAKTITIQEDKATLDPNFKPEWVAGGFAGHCTNQDEQTYTYEHNPDGRIITARWSDKRGAFVYCDKIITNGRHEFYDYNF